MAITRKVKIHIGIVVIFILYCLYIFFVKSDIYEINYLEEDKGDSYFSPSYKVQSRTFLISNPARERFEIWELLILNISDLVVDEKKSDYYFFNFFEEKWYLNRFFTVLHIDENISVYDAYSERQKLKYNELVYEHIRFKDNNPYITFKGTKSPYLVYFPFGYPKGSNRHWFLNFWYRKSDGTGSEDILFPASYELADSLKTKENEGRHDELVIPKELKDPKNKDKWKHIFRE